MKINETLSATIQKDNTIKLRDKETKAVINLTYNELQQIVKLYEKEQTKRTKLEKINNKIEECKKHGFEVKKERDWLWLISTDGRYNKKEYNEQHKIEVINKNKETEILKSLGFEYSSWRYQFYWDSTKHDN